MSVRSPGFAYQYGNGLPGSNMARNTPYVDRLTTPYTLYVYNAGAWHSAGSFVVFNATSLQTVAVSAAAPNNLDKLRYNSGATQWEPQP